jgi:hypothetical protein
MGFLKELNVKFVVFERNADDEIDNLIQYLGVVQRLSDEDIKIAR